MSAPLVRRVPDAGWVAVVRRGVVRRVRTAGLVVRLPVLETFVEGVDGPAEVPVSARATTRDGVPVLVLAEATVAVPRPRAGAPYVDRWPAAELAVEETIARTVTGWAASALTQTAGAARQPLQQAVRSAADEAGVEVHDLELVEVDVVLHGPR
jgi:hypothetical protein